MSRRTSAPDHAPTCWGRFCGGIRQLAFIVALLTAGGAVGWIWLQTKLDDQLRSVIERRLAQQFADTNLVVTVQGARRIAGPDDRNQGIEIRGLELRERQGQRIVLTIDEMWLACQCDLQRLLNQQIEIRHVAVRRPRLVLRGSRETLAGWRNWLPRATGSSPAWPTVTVDEGTIEWLAQEGAAPLALRGVSVIVRPASNEVRQALGWGSRTAQEREMGHVRAVADSDLFGRVELDALGDLAQGGWTLRGQTTGLRVARDLLALLPPSWSDQTVIWQTLEARGNLKWEAKSAETAGATPTFRIAGNFRDGRWSHPQIPAPVTELEWDFVADSTGFEVQRLAGRCGPAEMSGSLRTSGWRDGGPLDARLRLQRFELSRAWIDLLPDEVLRQWSKTAIVGEFDAELQVHYDGQDWWPSGHVVGRKMSALPEWFPYPLTAGQGRVDVERGRVRSHDVSFQVQGRPIVLDFEVPFPASGFSGRMSVKTPQGVPIDEQLLEALDRKGLQFVRTLQPRGEVVVTGVVERRSPQEPLRRELELEFHRGSIQYQRFPYPIERIEGKMKLVDDAWQIGELTGRNDSAYVVARGLWRRLDGRGTLRLELEAYDVALEEELRTALSPAAQRLWSQLQPRGTIDYLTVNVTSPHTSGAVGLDITLQKNPPSQNVEGRNVTLRPQAFPYQFDNVMGSVRLVDGQLEIEALRAEHARTQFRTRGRGRFEPDGSWSAQLSELSIDRLQLDHDLLAALPASVATRLAQLNWTGPLQVDGQLSADGGRPQETPRLGWDVRVDVENGQAQVGVPVEQLRGAARLVGGWQGSSWETTAELELDSAFVRGVQVTQVRGPVHFTPDRIVAGDAWIEPRRLNRPPRPVTAHLFGGLLSGDAIVFLGEEVGFRLQAGMQNASLQEVAQEFSSQRRDMAGRAFATLVMEGTTRGTHTWRGAGKVTCRDASLEQLPVMGALVKPTTARRTESALALSDLDFTIQGDRIYFDRIDLKGDALTLKGRGEMTFQRIVDLQFYTLMGRDDVWVPVVSPVLAEASKQMLEIRVTGPLESPVVDRKVVPAINDVLMQMFPELAAREQETPLINRIPTPRQILQRGARSNR
ncbi:MAG: hypothetical protein U0935_23965 [Pirellulales bacterium]